MPDAHGSLIGFQIKSAAPAGKEKFMGKHYYAALVEHNGRYCGFVLCAWNGENLLAVFARQKGLVAVNACACKQQAEAVVAYWNDYHRQHGTYMYS